MNLHALVTGPDSNFLFHMRTTLGQLGYLVETLPLDRGPSGPFAIAFVDDRRGCGVSRLRTLAGRGLVFALCAQRNETCAYQAGADEVFADPHITQEALVELIAEARRRLCRDIGGPLAPIIGRSPALLDVLGRVENFAKSSATVLICGETGTGKELLARGLHLKSPRATKPFVAINCAAIPESLVETEIFGHVRGAFTGAVNAHPGRIGAAEGGTLFLDELSELTLPMQAKLLRVLQEREYTPVGSSESRRADVRVVAATNLDLENEVKEGRFRADLYWRLELITIQTPPLRERACDVLPLAYHVLDRTNHAQERQVTGIDGHAQQVLLNHDWPGNVRELENTVERAVLLRGEGLITKEDIILRRPQKQRDTLLGNVRLPPDGTDLVEATALLEVLLINQALEKTNGNRSAAARLLNIDRSTLIYKLNRNAAAR